MHRVHVLTRREGDAAEMGAKQETGRKRRRMGDEQQMEAGVLIRGGDANEERELPLNMLIPST